MSGKGPDLKRYMEKRLLIKARARASRTPRRPRRRVPSQLVGKRKLVGTLRGYDQFMNLVVEDAIEQVSLTEKNEIGTVVIRGARAASQRLRRPVAHASHRRQLRRELRAHGAREAQIDRCTGNVIG
ncbi:hypothetical protein JL722_2325 [Aureococcus anophagefferens]|nr:hypothetical protein JL722_2325 [Aureococcus anophagefferens]